MVVQGTARKCAGKGENPDLQLQGGQEICSDGGNQFGQNVCNAGKITIGCSEWAGSTSATPALECRFVGVKVGLDLVMHLVKIHL